MLHAALRGAHSPSDATSAVFIFQQHIEGMSLHSPGLEFGITSSSFCSNWLLSTLDIFLC